MNTTICIPIPTELFLEINDFLRERNDPRDPVSGVLDAIDYWLHGLDVKPEVLIKEDGNNKLSHGYQWKKLFLPHGTELRMKYNNQFFYAKVKGKEIMFDGKSVTPAAMVNSISGTSRSAWRDIWIKRPEDRQWLHTKKWSLEKERQETRGNKLLNELMGA